MPDRPLLLIYVGEDFLFPTVFDARGAACSQPGRHFWLYFNATSRDPEYAFDYKTRVSNKESGYYGHFLEECANDTQVDIGGTSCAYYDLLDRSGLIGDLKNFYTQCSGDNASSLETAYVFVESIPAGQQKAFLAVMERLGFHTMAYSVLLSEVIMRFIMLDSVGLKPELGDKALILNAVNNKLVLTDSIFDGDRWMADGYSRSIPDFGDAPVKDVLVRHVVEEIDRYHGFLSEAQKQEEIEFQRSNADKWLALPRNGEGAFHIPDFYYKSYGGPYSCTVSNRSLLRDTEVALRKSTSAVTAYIQDRIGSSLRIAVFMGVAFDDKDLVDRIVYALNSPQYRVVTTSFIPKMLAVYPAGFGSVRNDFSRFDSEQSELKLQRDSVAAWGKSAAEIRNLRLRIKDEADNLAEQSGAQTSQFEEMVRLCHVELEHSSFDNARKKLETYLLPGELMRVAIQKASSLAEEVEQKQPMFESVKAIAGAGAAVKDIERQRQRILDMVQLSDEQEKKKADLLEQIDFYETHYDEFLRLKNKFDSREISASERRAIRDRMKRLTMEKLPDEVLRHVKVKLSARVVEEKAGLLRKKKLLRVEFNVLGGDKLPCDAVLNLSGSLPVQAMPDSSTCIRIEIPKDEHAFSQDFDLSQERRIPTGRPLYVVLYTEERQIDTDAIQNEDGSDKPFVRINIK